MERLLRDFYVYREIFGEGNIILREILYDIFSEIW